MTRHSKKLDNVERDCCSTSIDHQGAIKSARRMRLTYSSSQ